VCVHVCVTKYYKTEMILTAIRNEIKIFFKYEIITEITIKPEWKWQLCYRHVHCQN